MVYGGGQLFLPHSRPELGSWAKVGHVVLLSLSNCGCAFVPYQEERATLILLYVDRTEKTDQMHQWKKRGFPRTGATVAGVGV